ncbi:MAG: hypothetical protein ACXWK7_13845 [Caulobacteraceae bacterium]
MAITTFAPLGQWLGTTPLSHAARGALRASSWLAPLDETLHILALTTLFVSAAVLHLRLLGVVGRDRPIGPLARRLLPFTWSALVVLVLTGGLLVLNRPGRYFRSEMFLIKMGLILLAVAWTLVLQIGFSREAGFWEQTAGRRLVARSGGAVALVLWSGAVVCGRWIAYA